MDIFLSLTVMFSSFLEPGLDSSITNTRVECIIKCFYDSSCNSVFYESTTSRCHLSRINYDTSTASMVNTLGVVYIVVKSGNLTVVGPESTCPTDFTYSSSMKLCYKIQETPGSGDQHRLECEASGGHLMAITSPERDTFLESLTQSYTTGFFFGANYDGGMWKWANGAPYGDYLNWADGFPSNSQPCARKNRGDVQWKSFTCDSGTILGVCEFSVGFSQAELTLCLQ